MTKPRPAQAPGLSREVVLEQLEKVLASEVFRGSERSAKLLRFLVLRTLDGETASLKEYTLGADALGKGTSFDPRTDTIVRTEVSRLRGRLEKYYASEGKSDPVAITLVRGSYVPQFEERTQADTPAAGPSRGMASLRSRPALVALAVGAVLSAVLAVALSGPWRAPAVESAVSVAVLPFANLSSDAEQDFFSDGMTDEIGGALAKIPGLRVTARSSAFQFKGQNQDVRRVGQALGASHLIEGSVRRAGERVRITAQPVRANDGVRLWSENYERQLTDIFAVQEEIATAIATALRLPLGLAQGDTLEYAPVRKTDRFKNFMRKIGLVDYWRSNGWPDLCRPVGADDFACD